MGRQVKGLFFILVGIFFFTSIAQASVYIPMYSCKGVKIGTIRADDTIYGVLFTPDLRHLPPGLHGFHVHECPSCRYGGMAAGGHLDPYKTDLHHGPYHADGHLGDLPMLIVSKRGNATLQVLAPRLKLESIEGRALIIDAGEDNYLDFPDENGGSGRHIACGLIGYPH